MKPELVAAESMTLPAGPVWLTVARHDDGHYTGVATLLPSGQCIGLLVSEPLTSGCPRLQRCCVDRRVTGAEDALARLIALFGTTARAEATSLEQRQPRPPPGGPVLVPPAMLVGATAAS